MGCYWIHERILIMKKLLFILLLPVFAKAQYPIVNGWKQFRSPLQISGCTLWLAADSISGKSNNDTLGRWRDLSGNTNDAVQTNVLYKPVYHTGILNSKPVVNFTQASTQYMVSTLASTQPYTLFIVCRSGVGAGNQYFVDGSVLNAGVMSGGASNNTFTMYSGNVLSASATPTNFNYVGGIYDGVSSILTINGSTTTGDVGATNTTGMTIGANGVASGQFLNGDIAEIIVYNTHLSVANRQKVENYLKIKYAL